MTYTTGEGRGTRLTDAGRREIVRRRTEGEDMATIAEALGIGVRPVSLVCRQYGLSGTRGHPTPAEKVAEVVRRLRAGETVHRIRQECGVGSSTVYRLATTHGIPVRVPRAPKLSVVKPPRQRKQERLELERARVIARQAPQQTAQVVALETGKARWRCEDCFALASGPTCPNGHAPAWREAA